MLVGDSHRITGISLEPVKVCESFEERRRRQLRDGAVGRQGEDNDRFAASGKVNDRLMSAGDGVEDARVGRDTTAATEQNPYTPGAGGAKLIGAGLGGPVELGLLGEDGGIGLSEALADKVLLAGDLKELAHLFR